MFTMHDILEQPLIGCGDKLMKIVRILTFRILAFLYKLTTQICHFDEFLLIKWPISKNHYPKLAGVRNVQESEFPFVFSKYERFAHFFRFDQRLTSKIFFKIGGL